MKFEIKLITKQKKTYDSVCKCLQIFVRGTIRCQHAIPPEFPEIVLALDQVEKFLGESRKLEENNM